ncbi:MAG: SUMF1/EgtB/PvdO family nonheme iron enzyme [Verrucomicrobia bacterium]|nr:SUMF1/EgtB/PvdO family nonheme iron enzyme [Verrucomicrobiota bacterium]
MGSFAPNGYGLYDMEGYVMEWCWDWWSGSYYSSSPPSDPRGPTSGTGLVLRGGGWLSQAIVCRSAVRSFYVGPLNRYETLGFRSVRPAGQ